MYIIYYKMQTRNFQAVGRKNRRTNERTGGRFFDSVFLKNRGGGADE